jgi:inorganic phosphate transporter, PiT family
MSPFSLAILTVFLTLAFEFSNGWHDAANSIATVVSTCVLSPLRAVVWAASGNFVAAFVFGTAVASTVGKGLVHLEMVDTRVLLVGLVGAITWNLFILTLGLPTSSSHALMGSYGGAAVAFAGTKTLILSGWIMPLLFIVLSPVIGFAIGLTVSIITTWIVRNERPPENRPLVPSAAVGFCGGVQPWARHKRHPKGHGNH